MSKASYARFPFWNIPSLQKVKLKVFFIIPSLLAQKSFSVFCEKSKQNVSQKEENPEKLKKILLIFRVSWFFLQFLREK